MNAWKFMPNKQPKLFSADRRAKFGMYRDAIVDSLKEGKVLPGIADFLAVRLSKDAGVRRAQGDYNITYNAQCRCCGKTFKDGQSVLILDFLSIQPYLSDSQRRSDRLAMSGYFPFHFMCALPDHDFISEVDA